MSPSVSLTHLCSRAAIRLSALYGSPCDPVHAITTRPGSRLSTSSMSITSWSSTRRIPSSRAARTEFCIDRPRKQTTR